MRVALLPILASVMVLVPGRSHAQRGGGADAREPEAAVFLRMGLPPTSAGTLSDIRQGAPDGFPPELLPSGAEAELSGVSSASVVVVARLPAGQAFDHTRFGWTLEQSGWMIVDGAPQLFATGFPALRFCRGADFATVQARSGAGGTVLIRIAIAPEPRRSCAPAPGRLFGDVPIPFLSLPDGVQRRTGGGGGGADDYSQRARLETTLSVGDLVAHLLPQFQAVGWQIEYGPSGDTRLSITRLENRSRAGDPVTAQLVVTAFPSLPYVDLLVRFVRHKPIRTP